MNILDYFFSNMGRFCGLFCLDDRSDMELLGSNNQNVPKIVSVFVEGSTFDHRWQLDSNFQNAQMTVLIVYVFLYGRAYLIVVVFAAYLLLVRA